MYFELNLLPYREMARKARAKAFIRLLVLVFGAGIAVLVLGYSVLAERNDRQNGRNRFIQTEIRRLDAQIEEIEGLKAQRAALLQRKATIEDLQRNRTETVRLFTALAALAPDGVRIEKIVKSGRMVTLEGEALSNELVSSFFGALDLSPVTHRLTLVETRAKGSGSARQLKFAMRVDLPPLASAEEMGANKGRGRHGPIR